MPQTKLRTPFDESRRPGNGRRKRWQNRSELRSGSCRSCSRRRAGRLCNGQLLPINQNQALFSLLGTTFGGDGQVNFALPDLRAARRFTSAAGTRSASGAASRRTRSPSPSCRRIRTSPTARRPRRDTADHRPATCWRRRHRRHPLPAPANLVALNAGLGGQHRRHPGAPQHAAVPDAQLLHRPAGHLPEPELEETNHGTTIRRRDPDVRRATSPPPAGCSARGSCCRSPRTRRSSS